MFSLPDPTGYRELISGGRPGPAAGLARVLLRVLEVPYTWGVEYRNWRFDSGRAPVHNVDVPVISVGNITAGGTGKTPMVAWLAEWFRRQNLSTALISRGYGAVRSGDEQCSKNDEARELAQRLPEVPHLQNPDRVAAARQAIEQHACQVILLDDAFQHRRIHRDLDIVLIDALEPFGYRHVLPRGLLREPLRRLARADLIALSRADAVDSARRLELRAEVTTIAPNSIWIEIAHRPERLVNATGQSKPLEHLAGKRIAAFAGIGNPRGFYHSLAQLGCQLVARRAMPDHCPYDNAQLADLDRWLASHTDIEAVVCTGKDLVKLHRARLGEHPLWALTVGVDVTHGRAVLEQSLRQICAKAARAGGSMFRSEKKR